MEIRGRPIRNYGAPVAVHFLHAGKTGGTALKWAILNSGEQETPYGPMVVHGHQTRVADVPPGDVAVIFVRDPVSRFVSGFESRQRMGRPRYNNPWTQAETEAFLRFPTASALADGLACGSAPAREAMDSIGHLQQSLTYWLGSVNNVRAHPDRILFVGRQERFDSDVARLSGILRLTPPLTPPTDPVAAHRNPRTLSTPLSCEGADAVRAWYRDDYTLLEHLVPGFYRTTAR